MAVTQNKHVTESHLVRCKLAFSKLFQNCSVYFPQIPRELQIQNICFSWSFRILRSGQYQFKCW